MIVLSYAPAESNNASHFIQFENEDMVRRPFFKFAGRISTPQSAPGSTIIFYDKNLLTFTSWTRKPQLTVAIKRSDIMSGTGTAIQARIMTGVSWK
jgi:hypothetical protein